MNDDGCAHPDGRWRRGAAPRHPPHHDALQVRNLREVPRLRHRLRELGAAVGMSPRRIEEGAVVANELGNNLVQHGDGGTVLVRALEAPLRGLEMIFVDKGPGMDPQAEQPGCSGLGQGRLAARRLSDVFDELSAPGQGTVVLSRILDETAPLPRPGTLEHVVGGINVCHPFETCSGDAWSYWVHGPALTIMLVDGLGHGQRACDAATAALEAVDSSTSHGLLPDARLLEEVDARIRATRGCAATWATVDLDTGEHRGLGVGNAQGVFWSGQRHQDIPLKGGVVGEGASTDPLPSDMAPRSGTGWAIISSDGLRQDWRTRMPEGWQLHHPSTVAARLWRDSTTGTDDAAVVAMRWQGVLH